MPNVYGFSYRTKKIAKAIEDYQRVRRILDGVEEMGKIIYSKKSKPLARYLYSLVVREEERVKSTIKKWFPFPLETQKRKKCND